MSVIVGLEGVAVIGEEVERKAARGRAVMEERNAVVCVWRAGRADTAGRILVKAILF